MQAKNYLSLLFVKYRLHENKEIEAGIGLFRKSMSKLNNFKQETASQ